MKSDLDARPVFLQKENAIKGHFLICYLTVMLERIFQFNVLKNRWCTQDVIDFVKSFKAVKVDRHYLNMATETDFICNLATVLSAHITDARLTDTNIKSHFSLKM
jgi:transposase